MAPIIFYDLPSVEPKRCWSLNTWKGRLVLNFKGLDYKTEWVEYPDVAPMIKKWGLEPNPTGIPYTLPAVTLEDGTNIMESHKIAEAIEKLHPSPSLRLDSKHVAKLLEIIPKLSPILGPVFAPIIVKDVLSPPSRPYFDETREKRFGMPLQELYQAKNTDATYAAAKPLLLEISTLLRENSSGPFFDGKEAGFADLIFVGAVAMFRTCGGRLYKEVMDVDREAFTAHLEACEKWLARDDH